MSWWARLRAKSREAPPPVDERWVVVDTETSGLDPARDALLAIGAVAVDAQGVRLGDSFEILIHHLPRNDAGNAHIHGIGIEAQAGGVPAREALRAFLDYVAGAPCIAFHAPFDRAVLKRACDRAGLRGQQLRWLDAAALAEALASRALAPGRRSLDDWLAAFGIGVVLRHNAAGDALATAELLLRLRALATTRGARGFAGLERLCGQRKWLGGSA